MNRQLLNRKFHALLCQMGWQERKEDILSGYGVPSSRDLSDDQLAQLCNRLEDEKRGRYEHELKKHRSLALRLLTDMGVYYTMPYEEKNACWRRIDDFLIRLTKANQRFYRMDPAQLQQLARQLRSIMDKRYVWDRDLKRLIKNGVGKQSDKAQCTIVYHMGSDDSLPN